MSLLKKAKAWLHDDWCKDCLTPMVAQKKQLFLLPLAVGHYESFDTTLYYRKNLIRVTKKSDIPAGTYALRQNHAIKKLLVILKDEKVLEIK